MLSHAAVRHHAQPAHPLEAGLSATEAFGKYFVPGFDCRLSTMRNTLARHGHRFTNGMVLGLSGALCFSYADHRRSRLPFATVAGISDQTLEGVPAALGVHVHRSRHDPVQAPGSGLFEAYLDEGLAVSVAVYRPALRRAQFRGREAALAGGSAIGFHYVTLTERHPGSDEFTVFETDSAVPFRVTRAELMEAWYYDARHARPVRDPHQPCDGLWYAMRVPARLDATAPTAIRHSVQRVVGGFFAPPADGMGAAGLESFRAAAATWHGDAVDPASLSSCIRVLRLLEYHLSGGGFGRRLYGRFLAEVSMSTNDWTLRSIAREFAHSAEAWKAFVRELQAALGPGAALDRQAVRAAVARHLDPVAELETAQMRSLERWL